MSSRFVKPEVVTLPLSTNGDTITIRKRLNYGEETAAYARMYVPTLDGKIGINRLQFHTAMACAYLVDWTLKDDEGQIVPIRGLSPEEIEMVLNNLEPQAVGEIKEAIDKHEAAVEAARAEKKRIASGETASAPTSPSAD